MTKNISLIQALAEGWSWMIEVLFRPFSAGKWLVIGFSAWLAGLASCGSGGGSGTGSSEDLDGSLPSAQSIWEWMTANAWIVALIAVGCLGLMIFIVLVLWISSRAKFIFLDNVVRNRAEIVEPWKRYRRLGNSLFAFHLLAAGTLIAIAIGLALAAWLVIGSDGGFGGGFDGIGVGASITAVMGSLFLILLTAYVFFFTDAFVVPLMRHFDLGLLDGWRRFLQTLNAHPFRFFGTGLFVFGLFILATVLIVITGVMTCCLGFLLLMVPYIGTLVLLPLLVTYRAFTVAYLAQFEPELALPRPSGTETEPEPTAI